MTALSPVALLTGKHPRKKASNKTPICHHSLPTNFPKAPSRKACIKWLSYWLVVSWMEGISPTPRQYTTFANHSKPDLHGLIPNTGRSKPPPICLKEDTLSNIWKHVQSLGTLKQQWNLAKQNTVIFHQPRFPSKLLGSHFPKPTEMANWNHRQNATAKEAPCSLNSLGPWQCEGTHSQGGWPHVITIIIISWNLFQYCQ